MAKTIKPQSEKAKILMRRLRGMARLEHFEKNDRFVVLLQVNKGDTLWIEWSKFVELFGDFKAIVDAKKLKK